MGRAQTPQPSPATAMEPSPRLARSSPPRMCAAPGGAGCRPRHQAPCRLVSFSISSRVKAAVPEERRGPRGLSSCAALVPGRRGVGAGRSRFRCGPAPRRYPGCGSWCPPQEEVRERQTPRPLGQLEPGYRGLTALAHPDLHLCRSPGGGRCLSPLMRLVRPEPADQAEPWDAEVCRPQELALRLPSAPPGGLVSAPGQSCIGPVENSRSGRSCTAKLPIFP